ncbi:MAG: toprim domain-containing protein [Akkermansiaceae bacterium]
MEYYYEASEVKAAVSSKLKEVVQDIYPECKIKGAEARIGGLDGGKGSSMSISLSPQKFGAYYDHATNDKGNLIDILQAVKNLDYCAAIEWLGSNYTTCTTRKWMPSTSNTVSIVAADHIAPLSDDIISYAETARKVGKDTLEAYQVATALDDSSVVAFPCYDHKKSITKIGYCATKEKKYWSSTACGHNLFGKKACSPNKSKGVLVITEGQWDAMSYYEAGIPAVSIPSGAKNLQWINEDWDYINQFHTIYLSFDMDDAGQDIIPDITKRLGIDKCKIIQLPHKDANECLTKENVNTLTNAYDSAIPPQTNELVPATSLKEETFDLLKNGVANLGDNYFLPDFNIKIRPHEMTLIFGQTFHGKSQFVSNQIAYDAAMQTQSVIASFEQTNRMTLASIIMQYCADAHITANEEAFNKVFDDLAPFVTFYDSMDRGNPERLVEIFTYAHKRKGVNRFILDNVMSLDSNRDNNAEQANIAHVFRKFTKDYPVHLFVVAHPRKAGQGDEYKAPSLSDIRGASEWGDIPENIITVWRNMQKQEDIAKMVEDKFSSVEVARYNREVPDSKIFVRKQRATGEIPQKNVWFHKDTQRYTAEPSLPKPFYTENDNNEDPF